jgi:prepilin-type N-terminal cleavage/methylation domain-containing protein
MTKQRRAFTLIELLVVIAIIAILAAILFPVFAQAKASAKAIAGLSNLKQLALAAQMYYNDNDDTREGRQVVDGSVCEDYRQIIYPYVKSTGLFHDQSNQVAQYLDGFSDQALRNVVCPSDVAPLGNLPQISRGYYWNNIFSPSNLAPSGLDFFDYPGLSLSSVKTVASVGDVVEGRGMFSDEGPFSQGWVDNVDSDTSWLGAANPSTGLVGSNLSGKYNEQAENVGYMDGHAKRTPYISQCANIANVGADAANCAGSGCQGPAPVWKGDPTIQNFWNFSQDDIAAAAAQEVSINNWNTFPNAVSQYCTSMPQVNQ